MPNSDVMGFFHAIQAGDLNAVATLFDWLKDREDQADRRAQFAALDAAFGKFFANAERRPYTEAADVFLREVGAIFWRDLVTVQDAIRFIQERLSEEPGEIDEPPSYTGIVAGAETCPACGTLHMPGICPNPLCILHTDHGRTQAPELTETGYRCRSCNGWGHADGETCTGCGGSGTRPHDRDRATFLPWHRGYHEVTTPIEETEDGEYQSKDIIPPAESGYTWVAVYYPNEYVYDAATQTISTPGLLRARQFPHAEANTAFNRRGNWKGLTQPLYYRRGDGKLCQYLTPPF